MSTADTAKVRVVLCTSGGVVGSLVLQQLLASEAIQVVGLIESSRVLRASYSWWRGAWEQVRASGIRYALYLWTATTLAEILERIARIGGRGIAAADPTTPCLVTRNLNDSKGVAFVAAISPDVLLSAFFNQRIEGPVRRLPRFGAINIHPALLPDFKGVDPVFFTRLRGAKQFGVTVHRVDDHFDTGQILAQGTHAPCDQESVLKTTADLYRLGSALFVERLETVIDPHAGVTQAEPGRYDSWPSARDVAALRAQGFRLVKLRDLFALACGTFAREAALRS